MKYVQKTLVEVMHKIDVSATGARAAIDRLGLLGDADSRANAQEAVAQHRAITKEATGEIEAILAEIRKQGNDINDAWVALRELAVDKSGSPSLGR